MGTNAKWDMMKINMKFYILLISCVLHSGYGAGSSFQVQQIVLGGSQCGGKGCGCAGAPQCPDAAGAVLPQPAPQPQPSVLPQPQPLPYPVPTAAPLPSYPNPTCLGANCATSSQCPCPNSECHKSRCVCQQGSEEISGQCIQMKCDGLGEACSVSRDCKVEHAECYRGHCLCREGYYEDEGSCRGILGESCLSDNDCPGKSMECNSRQQCACSNGYTQSNHMCMIDVDENKCVSTSDCGDLFGAECMFGECACPTGTYERQGRCVADNWCRHDADCGKVMKGSVCRNFVCVCADGYKEEGSICVPELWCTRNMDCTHVLPGGVCTNHLCSCPHSHRNMHGTCVESECMVDRDCGYTLRGGVCSQDHRCVCPQGYIESNNQCVRDDSCSVDSDCEGYLPGSVCIRSRCTCPRGYEETSRGCVKEAECASDRDCRSILEGGVCGRTGECECGRYDQLHDGKCIPDEWCTSDGDCAASLVGAICDMTSQPHKCICKTGFKENQGQCLPEDWCSSDSDCAEDLPGSVCDSETQTCDCPENTILFQKMCLSNSGCFSDEECNMIVKGSTCFDNHTCGCPEGKKQVEDFCAIDIPAEYSFIMSEVSELVEDTCMSDADCHAMVNNSICDEYEQCSCLPHMKRHHHACISEEEEVKVGGCESDDDCREVVGSKCEHSLGEGYCACPPTTREFMQVCIPESWCTSDELCSQNLTGAICNEDRACGCPEEMKEHAGECIKKEGCTSNLDCSTLLGSTCNAEHDCVCGDGFKQHQDQCIPESWCRDDDECQTQLVGSVCVLPDCVCLEGFVDKEGICLPEGVCMHDADCERNITGSICTEGTCHCAEGQVIIGYRCVDANLCSLRPQPDKYCDNKIQGSMCRMDKCTCSLGYIEYEGKCVKEVVPLGESCGYVWQCLNGTDNSFCDGDSICACTGNYIPDESGLKCHLPTNCLGESCVDDSHCQLCVAESYCNAGTCECSKPKIPYDNQCYSPTPLGYICSVEEQCLAVTNHSVCPEELGICICDEGFTSNRETQQCDDMDAMKAPSWDQGPQFMLGEECMAYGDCAGYAECQEGVCTCPYPHFEYEGQCLEGKLLRDQCNVSVQCLYTTPNSNCDEMHVPARCMCDEGYHINDTAGASSTCQEDVFIPVECHPAPLGTSCPCPESCAQVTVGSICEPTIKYCVCEVPSFPWNDRCYNETLLGESCSIHVQCQVYDQLSECNNHYVCSCIEGYFNYEGTCHPVRAIGTECDIDAECKEDSETSYCAEDGLCHCYDSHIAFNKQCFIILGLDETCEINDQCNAGTNNSVCDPVTNICMCGGDYIEIDRECWPIKYSGEGCDFDKQCTHGGKLAAKCFLNTTTDRKECVCDEGTFSYEGQCLEAKNLTHSCAYDIQCTIVTGNSTCDPNTDTCLCAEGFVRFLDECWRVKDLNETCDLSMQCPENSVCVTDHYGNDYKCLCQYGYFENDDHQCSEEKYPGDSCTSSRECAMSEYAYQSCVDGVCTCGDNQFVHNDTKTGQLLCYTKTPGLNEWCLSNETCQATNKDYMCYYGICICGPTTTYEYICNDPYVFLPDPGHAHKYTNEKDESWYEMEISEYQKFYLGGVGSEANIQSKNFPFSYPSKSEFWYEIYCPPMDDATYEEMVLEVYFQSLITSDGTVFEVYSSPGISIGKVEGASNNELANKNIQTPNNRMFIKLHSGDYRSMGFNLTVKAVPYSGSKHCENRINLVSQDTWYEVGTADYPDYISGYLSCYYNVEAKRNEILHFIFQDYDIKTFGLAKPNPAIVIQEKVIDAYKLAAEIISPEVGSTFKLLANNAITTSLFFTALGRMANADATFYDTQLRFKAKIMATHYTSPLGRDCGSDNLLSSSESMNSISTPIATTEDLICIWTFEVPADHVIEFQFTNLDVSSKYGNVIVYDGNINNTRPFEYPNVIEFTSFLRSFSHIDELDEESHNNVIFTRSHQGYITTRVTKGSNKPQLTFNVVATPNLE